MSVRFDDWEGDALQHFGTRGMKWGQRRYQNEDGSLTPLGRERYGSGGNDRGGKRPIGNRSRLGIKHDLNKLDREQTYAKVRADYYEGKAQRKLARLEKKRQKKIREADEFVEKYVFNKDKAGREHGRELSREGFTKEIDAKIKKVKTEGAGKKAREYKTLLDNSRKMTERIIESAQKRGLSIHSRDCVRQVNKGRNFVLAVLGGVSAATLGVGVSYSTYAAGKHYRVKNDGLGTRTHRSGRHTRDMRW